MPIFSFEPPQKAKRYEGKTLEEWRQAVKDLSPSNPESRAAVPGLIAILQDQSVPWFTRRQMGMTLGRMGKRAQKAVPVLIGILDEPGTKDHSPRVWAGKSLSIFGPAAGEATPQLAAILKNAELPLAERQVALEALGLIGGCLPAGDSRCGRNAKSSRRAESSENQADRDALREVAAEVLAGVGKDAAIAVPVLLRCLNDAREPMRRKTVQALGRIGPASQLAIPALVATMAFDDSPAVRDAVETALAGIGPPVVSALVHLLEDKEAELRQRAVRSLGLMKTTARPAVGKLREVLKDEDPHVRFVAAESLWQITSRADDSLLIFVETLKSPERELRMQAFRALTEELGPAAIPAREALLPLLKHPDSAVRQAAKKALDRIPTASAP